MEKNKIKQETINNAVWAACDTFRGVLSPGQYKDYILVMLFLKYISDIWKSHYEEYKEKYGDDQRRIERKLKRERFMLPMINIKDYSGGKEKIVDSFRADFYSLYDRRENSNIGLLINTVLDEIEKENKDKLEKVFRNINFNSETELGKKADRNKRLKDLLEDFNKPELDFSPEKVDEDIIGNAYIYLIERFASSAGKKAGEFYTPHKVSELVAKIAMPENGNKICDPACGSGGLLIEVAKLIKSKNYALFGMEVNGSTWALARMNMFLHGTDSARIKWCNTLTSPELVEGDKLMKFDVVVANPPFSLDKWGADDAKTDKFNRFWRGIPPKSKGDWAFLTHMIESALEKKGRVSVVVPHGVLFRGNKEGAIRKKVIEENLLDAVIGLPGNLFPTTSIPVAILVFDKSRQQGGKNENKKEIVFIDASKDFKSGKNQNILRDKDINKILEAYTERSEIEKYCHIANLKEVEDNDFNLNIPRYVDTFEEEEEVDIKEVQSEIEVLERELEVVRAKMKTKLKEMGLEIQ